MLTYFILLIDSDVPTSTSGRYAQKLFNVIKQGTFKQIAPKQEVRAME